MWLLESDGDVFHGKLPAPLDPQLPIHNFNANHATGKKLWLRPGKKFIFGRTSAEGM
jgi:hypothetical protein